MDNLLRVTHVNGQQQKDYSRMFGLYPSLSLKLMPSSFILSKANGLSYGLGVHIRALSIEYMDYIEDDYYDISAISLGYIYRF
jgi:hypothetical protein